MKIKLLSTIIAGVILAGCGSDNNNSVAPEVKSASIQAYDGAIWGIQGSYNCGDGDKVIGLTNYDGFVKTTDEAFVNTPENCSFTFKPDGNVVPQDTSNGKYLPTLELKAPKGLFKKGEAATASPLSTLIANKLGDNAYDEATATQVLEDLGLGEVANTCGISVTELLTDTDGAVKKLVANPDFTDVHSKLIATTHVLADTLAAQPNASTDEVTKATKLLAESTLAEHPNYPKNKDGDPVHVELAEILADDDTFTSVKNAETVEDIQKIPDLGDAIKNPAESKVPERPEDPDNKPTPPPTGGTGGGTGGGDGSSGGGTGN
ncbi:hypothetical protein C0W80_17930 [Photobacterium leiognathi subsp. mandapamensis]|uniref:hypothetical protein n=1 Tax=Photobacterium leiognathi TaxID=553611 RepID=UPI000D16D0AD|nr:hypothetical protein [Photobacterium leiognathi]PSU95993.1 hypothetical protein C0W80_17930 [Photobacterium leiognathi subsp. mandapamensis]